MVKLVAATCPRCGASLDLPSDLRKAHCLYCGASVIIGVDGTQKAECRICDGFGRLETCRACKGEGKCSWKKVIDHLIDHATATYMTKGESHCDKGLCSACGGSGKNSLNVSCPYCNGTGSCPRCLGTGNCPICKGIGYVPNPKGDMKCYMCHGDGIVDIEKADKRWSERCPVCKMTLVTDESFCSHCGRAHKCPKCGKEWSGAQDKCGSCGYERATKP